MPSENNKKWTILKTEYKLKTPYLNVRLDTCETLRGDTIDYYIVERSLAVGVVAFTPDRKMVLQRQYRHPVQEWLIEITAGLVGENEDPKVAAERELLEESGYRVNSLVRLGELYFSPGVLNQRYFLYIGFNAQRVQEPSYDKGEDMETVIMDVDEVFQRIAEGEIKDGDTVAALFMAKAYLDQHGYAGSS